MKIRYYLPASGVYRKSALRRRERLLPAGLPSHFDCDEGSEILRFRAIPVQLHWQIVAALRSAGRYGPDTGASRPRICALGYSAARPGAVCRASEDVLTEPYNLTM